MGPFKPMVKEPHWILCMNSTIPMVMVPAAREPTSGQMLGRTMWYGCGLPVVPYSIFSAMS